MKQLYKNSSLVILFLISITVGSCIHRPTNVLNEDEMENFLFDMHLLESSLRVGLHNYSTPKEKQFYYIELFKKYDIKKSDYDSSIVWYTKKPKKYERIYKKVLERIDTLKTATNSGKYQPIDSTTNEEDIWKIDKEYYFTKDSAKNTLFFEINDIKFNPKDKYQLSLLQSIASSDSVLNPYIVMYINYANGKIDSIYTRSYKDSVRRKYTLSLSTRLPFKVKSISGYLLGGNTNQMPKAKIEDIKLIRTKSNK